MANNSGTFETVCEYAQLMFKKREGESRSTDFAHQYFLNPWTQSNILVLYEGEKRTLQGHKEPEVCWICIDCYGKVSSIPSRHLRKMMPLPGFKFVNGVWGQIFGWLNWIKEEKNDKNER